MRGEMNHVRDDEDLMLALGYHQHESNIHEWRAFSALYSFERSRIIKTQKGGKQLVVGRLGSSLFSSKII